MKQTSESKSIERASMHFILMMGLVSLLEIWLTKALEVLREPLWPLLERVPE